MPGVPVDLANIRYERFDSPSEATISAKSGKSHRLLEIYCDAPANKTYMDVVIGQRTVMRVPLKFHDCLFVAPYSGSMLDRSIIALLGELFGPDFAFEADEDEDITLVFSGDPGTVHVFYVDQPPGINKTALGRSLHPNLLLGHIITHSSAVNATGNYALDKAVSPTGFPAIANGFTVPANTAIELKAIAFASTASGSTVPTYLHIWDRNYEFFDPENHTGISVEPNKNVLVADIKTFDIFRVANYRFLGGHKLTFTFDASYDGTNTISAETLALILFAYYLMA